MSKWTISRYTDRLDSYYAQLTDDGRFICEIIDMDKDRIMEFLKIVRKEAPTAEVKDLTGETEVPKRTLNALAVAQELVNLRNDVDTLFLCQTVATKEIKDLQAENKALKKAVRKLRKVVKK